MINGMTGFGSRESNVAGLGNLKIELRSTNHKFLDMVLHLPEGYLYLEEKIKSIIAKRIKRGRITAIINIDIKDATEVSINKTLLKRYINQIKKIKKEFNLKEDISLDTLINLPGVLSLHKIYPSRSKLWSALKKVLEQALDDLVKMRKKEGQVIQEYLRPRLKSIQRILEEVKVRFRDALQIRLAQITNEEEQNSFLKNVDIQEEIARLAFHLQGFVDRLEDKRIQAGGKELDFLAQEMQREANTMAAKSFEGFISGRIVKIKSQIEQLREQLQNVE